MSHFKMPLNLLTERICHFEDNSLFTHLLEVKKMYVLIKCLRRSRWLCSLITGLIHSLVFNLEGRAWQEPEPSHVTGMALAHCILGKFLGVVCHCFPPAFRRSHFSRQVPPSATTREILAAKGGTVGEKDVR